MSYRRSGSNRRTSDGFDLREFKENWKKVKSMTQISPHFTLEQLCYSSTAIRLNIDNTPDQEHIDNLKLLCENILEPLYKVFGDRLKITSAYRCKQLNKAIGGSQTSQHISGCAADSGIQGMTTKEYYKWAKTANLPFDQMIEEFASSGGWLHISYSRLSRREFLIATKENGITKYTPDTA